MSRAGPLKSSKNSRDEPTDGDIKNRTGSHIKIDHSIIIMNVIREVKENGGDSVSSVVSVGRFEGRFMIAREIVMRVVHAANSVIVHL